MDDVDLHTYLHLCPTEYLGFGPEEERLGGPALRLFKMTPSEQQVRLFVSSKTPYFILSSFDNTCPFLKIEEKKKTSSFSPNFVLNFSLDRGFPFPLR